MIIKIKIPDKDPEMALNYFHQKCLDLFVLGEIDEFEVEIEGTAFKKKRSITDGRGNLKVNKSAEIEEDDKLIGDPLNEEDD